MTYFSITLPEDKSAYLDSFKRIAYSANAVITEEIETKDGYLFTFEFPDSIELEKFKAELENQFPFLFYNNER